MKYLVSIAWGLLALVHLLPGLAFLRPRLLTQLYGVQPGTDLFLLMHHRAALFAAVVVLCIWSAASPAPRSAAAVLTAISMLSFLALYVLAEQPKALRTIALADAIALPALALVIWNATHNRS